MGERRYGLTCGRDGLRCTTAGKCDAIKGCVKARAAATQQKGHAMSFYIAAAALPFVGAFHRFACNMGYRYAPWRDAAKDAGRVFLLLALIAAGMSACQATV